MLANLAVKTGQGPSRSWANESNPAVDGEDSSIGSEASTGQPQNNSSEKNVFDTGEHHHITEFLMVVNTGLAEPSHKKLVPHQVQHHTIRYSNTICFQFSALHPKPRRAGS